MEEIVFSHYSVMLYECIEQLNIRPDMTYVDCTTGGGGHSLEIVKRLSGKGRLICFDRDTDALTAAEQRLAPYKDKITFVHDNFASIDAWLTDLDIDNLGGVLADLGCSSYQFDTPKRGFSYQHDAPLDMRMDPSAVLTASTVVNTYPQDKLCEILWKYGEEKFAGKIAGRIVAEREKEPILTTGRLVSVIKSALPKQAKEGGHHPAKRSFQAIRIEVNKELDAIEPLIRSSVSHLLPGGRLVILSFQSLEDRIVKQTYQDLSEGCTCPRDFPVCICGKKPQIRFPSKKPLLPSPAELSVNPRSRSAKLRVAEKTDPNG